MNPLRESTAPLATPTRHKELHPRIWRLTSPCLFIRVSPTPRLVCQRLLQKRLFISNIGSLLAMYLPLQEPFLDGLLPNMDSSSYNQVRFSPCPCSWSLINSVPACARIRLHMPAMDRSHMYPNHRSKVFRMMQALHPRKRNLRLCHRSVIMRCASTS